MFPFRGGRRYGRQMCFVNYRPRSTNDNVNSSRVDTSQDGATGLSSSQIGHQGHSQGFARDEQSKKRGKSPRRGKKRKDIAMQWLLLDDETEAAALSFMRKSIMSPFLFHNKSNYSSKVISWLQDGGILPSSLSLKEISLSEDSLRVVDMMEVVIDQMVSEIETESEIFLQKISVLADELNKCSNVAKVMSLCREQWKDFITEIRQRISVHPSMSEDKIYLGIIVAIHQVVKHVKQTVGVKPTYQSKIERNHRKKEKELEKCKIQGNDLFRRKKYMEAVSTYSQALIYNPFSHILYGNRAQSFLKMVKYREALSDARRAVYLEPTWEKGHYRLAEAYNGLGLLENALDVNRKAQRLCGETPFLVGQADKFMRAQLSTDATETRTPTLASLDDDIPDNCSSSEGEESCSCHCDRDEEEENYFTCDSMPERMSSDGECCSCCRASHSLNCCVAQNGAEVSLSSSSSQPFNEGSVDLDDLDSIPSLASDSDSLLEFGEDFSDRILGDEVSLDHTEATSSSEPDLNYSDSSDGELLDSRFSEPLGLFVPPVLSPGMEILRQLSLATFHNFDAALEAFQRLDAALQDSEGDNAPPPALPEVIESLRSSKITQELIDDNPACPICHCDYELGEEATHLPCEHFYHSPCITTWLKMHATCPTCRYVLPY